MLSEDLTRACAISPACGRAGFPEEKCDNPACQNKGPGLPTPGDIKVLMSHLAHLFAEISEKIVLESSLWLN